MEFIKRHGAQAADLRIHERDFFAININDYGVVSACGGIENRIPVHDDRQFLVDHKAAQIVICAFGMFDFGIESVGAQCPYHALVGRAGGLCSASDLAELLLGFADAKISQHHLEAGGSAIGVLVGDGAQTDHKEK